MRKLIHDFRIGIRSFGTAFRFIIKHKFYWYLPIPAGLMLLIYFIGSEIINWNSSLTQDVTCSECTNMNATIWFLLEMLLSITIGIILMKFAKYIVVIVLSPLLSIISQQVEKKLTNNTYPFNLQQTLHDIKRGVRIALRNIMWEYIFFIIIVGISSIGWKSASESPIFYLTFVFGFFYYGFSFIDYVNERRKLDIDQSIYFIRSHRGLAIAIGCIYSLMILVPVDLGRMLDFSNFGDMPWQTLGIVFFEFSLWLLASFAPILAIVAATLATHEVVDLSQSNSSSNVGETKNKNS